MEPSAKVESLKKVEPSQTMSRVLLMAIGDDGQPTPFRVSGENNGQIGGSSSGGVETVTAGDGLTNSGSATNPTLDVVVDASTIEINTNTLRVKDAGITYAKLSTANKTSLARKNGAINADFRVWQRGTSSPTTVNNGYGPDHWRLLLPAANVATIARSTDAPANSKYSCAVTTGATTNNKFGIFQPIEGVDVYRFRGQTATLSAQLKATNLSDIRMAIIEWTGTEDSISATPISGWNATNTNPNLVNPSWVYVNTPTNLAVGASFARYSVSGSVSTSATNLGIFIWSDDTSTTTTTDLFKVGEVQLEVGSEVTPFEFRPFQQELALCQRYCWVQSVAGNEAVAHGSANGTNQAIFLVRTPVTMRQAPTLTATFSDWQLTDGNTNHDVTSSLVQSASTPDILRMVATLSTSPLTQFRPYNLAGDAGGTRLLIAESEL